MKIIRLWVLFIRLAGKLLVELRYEQCLWLGEATGQCSGTTIVKYKVGATG